MYGCAAAGFRPHHNIHSDQSSFSSNEKRKQPQLHRWQHPDIHQLPGKYSTRSQFLPTARHRQPPRMYLVWFEEIHHVCSEKVMLYTRERKRLEFQTSTMKSANTSPLSPFCLSKLLHHALTTASPSIINNSSTSITQFSSSLSAASSIDGHLTCA